MEKDVASKDFFKLKVAIFFGYNGLPFHGLQKNKDVDTVEETLEKALFDNDLIPGYNYGNLNKMGWKRAARTDKGVHAITNVVNCKVAIKQKFIEETVEDDSKPGNEEEKKDEKKEVMNKVVHKTRIDFQKIINCLNALLKDVHVFAIRRVTKHFDSKQSARSRYYEYLIPTWCFKKPDERGDTSLEFDLKILERINQLAKKFLGTKNFHNYTRKMKANNPKAKRFIIEFEAKVLEFGELTTPEKMATYNQEEVKNLRYFLFKIKGQSFIYHQIRKMIGVMVQMFQLSLPEVYIENSFLQNVFKVWLAPPEGLFLNRVCFDNYNQKKDIPELLAFSEKEEKSIETFRKEVIYPLIIDAELKEKIYTEWLKVVCNPMNIDSESEDDIEAGFES